MLTKSEIAELRGFGIDHEPDGWPAIPMRDITALCDMADAYITLRERVEKAQRYEPGAAALGDGSCNFCMDAIKRGEYIRRSDVLGEG